MFKNNNDILIKFNNVCFGYQPKQHVLSNVSFSIRKNEHICIIGANGCGKSTLAKILAGLFKPSSGTILFKNRVVTKQNVKLLKKASGIIFENPDNQFIGLTVQDDIAFGLENQCVAQNKMQSIINKVAKYVGISNLLKANPKQLSGGQKQLVACASVLAMEPEFIVLDEATSMLDNKAKQVINDLMLSLKTKQHKTIISITHDMDEAAKADRVIVLNRGKVVLIGTPQQVFSSPKISKLSLEKPYAYQLVDKLGKKLAQRINYEK